VSAYIYGSCNAVNDWDDNITTKIVKEAFPLQILSLDSDTNEPIEANITKVDLLLYQSSDCSGNYQRINVCDDSTSNVCPDTDANGCGYIDGINITNANKCARVYIEGRYKYANTDEVNSSYSIDKFAIRPNNFVILNMPAVMKAGVEFNITVKALDKEGNDTKDYNETLTLASSPAVKFEEIKKGCKTGELTITQGGEFKDGNTDVGLKYSEVGEVNASVFEIAGSEYAIVDKDDGVSAQRRFITKATVGSTEFVVDHFDTNIILKDYDENNFTYLDSDLNITSKAYMQINAKNHDNQITQNYNTLCYAKDCDVNLTLKLNYNNPSVGVGKSLFYMTWADGNISDVMSGSDIENNLTHLNITLGESNFTTENNGSAKIVFNYNFDRNVSKYSNPFVSLVDELNVTNKDTNDSVFTSEGNATFYYAKVEVDDVMAADNDINNTLHFGVYDENESDSLLLSQEAVGYNIFKNPLHQSIDGNISAGDIFISKDYTTDDSKNITSSFDVSVGDITNGDVNINIKRNDTSIKFAVVHILSPSLAWMWYSKYSKEYNITAGSNCAQHYCFIISWDDSEVSKEIGSGEFKGTESNITEGNTTKRGVKIYR